MLLLLMLLMLLLLMLLLMLNICAPWSMAAHLICCLRNSASPDWCLLLGAYNTHTHTHHHTHTPSHTHVFPQSFTKLYFLKLGISLKT
jgi:hypothetical protein